MEFLHAVGWRNELCGDAFTPAAGASAGLRAALVGRKAPTVHVCAVCRLPRPGFFCLERLGHLVDSKTGWDGPKFFEENLLLFDCVTEAYWVQGLMDWNGRKQYELLDLQRGEDGLDNARVKEAEALVQGMLSMSSTMKLPHGLVTAGRDYLTDIRDNPENHDADIRPGTFAAYLRQASETFEQTKELVPLKMPVIEKVLLQAGITEVVG
ncbi:hypothetical protein PCG10_007138 [Penicillium crustosum]|uniref:Uncharacterized protein n=1 Tax=Penicillium crustosum TaxID=36656 RepID=A0A9P5L824_PENCR|nr:hypothetical protein PCG10_007138 [Penicillium crustosum]